MTVCDYSERKCQPLWTSSGRGHCARLVPRAVSGPLLCDLEDVIPLGVPFPACEINVIILQRLLVKGKHMAPSTCPHPAGHLYQL